MPSFTQILNLSVSASFLVLAVALLRLILKKAPKAFHCCLWALVAIRLICPLSFESELSLIPSREVIPQEYLYMEPFDHDTPAKLEIVTNPVYDAPVTIDTDTTVDRLQHWDLMGTVIWLAGMGAMAIYAFYSYLSLRLRVRMAGWVQESIYECDDLDSPFILGVLRPRIYLPSGLDEITRAHVLAHEKAHLKRLDHLWKPLGFVLLTIHWFNPIMWLGYILLCRDIELACDEKVIRNLDKPGVRAYSEALVSCSVSHRMIAVCPLAFGEVGVKGRIRSMLHYKKPGFWAVLIAAIAGIALAVCFLTDPVQKPASLEDVRAEDGFTIVSQNEETISLEIERSALPEDILNGKNHAFEPGQIVLSSIGATTIYAQSGRMFGNELLLTIGFEYSIDDSGAILLPYRIKDGGREWTAEVTGNDKVRLAQYGPDPSIAVAIDMAYYKASGSVDFDLTLMNLLTYARENAPIALILEQEYRVEEVRYTHPTEGFPYAPEQLPVYAVCASPNGELYLSTVKEDASVQSYGNCGILQELRLTEENFDGRFPTEGWADADIRTELRRDNLAAWRIYPKYTNYTRESILLLQRDGSLWLAFNAEPDGQFQNLYRLTSEPSEPGSAIITTTFYYPSGMNEYTCPYFTLSSDGSFHLTESPLSSYFGCGAYSLTEDGLILRTDDGLYTWYFIPDGESYRFDADRSSPIRYYPDLKSMEPLPDETRFLPTGSRKRALEKLDLAVKAVFEQCSREDGDEQYLITECHDILDAALISGTPPVGSKEHEELVTIQAVGLVRRYTVRGTALEYNSEKLVHAAMTFQIEGDAYTLQTLKTADDMPLAEFYSPRAMELWLEYEPQVGQLQDQCDWLAQLWVEEHPPTAGEVESLLDIICSSPSQYSNPGAYIDAHPREYQRLLQCERTMVQYCFEQFAAGNQMDLRGHIMSLACDIIIGETEELCIDSSYMTGQGWFNLFAKEADERRAEIGTEELSKFYPYHAMALECLGI